MAVKSIIDIDINDANFKNLLKSWQQFEAAVKNMPGAWRKVNIETEKLKSNVSDIAEDADASLESETKRLRQQEKSLRLTTTISDHWKRLAQSSRSFATNIEASTLNVLRWLPIGTAIGGLLGIGGLWGIDRLANLAAGSRRTAMGLGVTPGQQRAFGTAFERELIEPTAFLQGISTATTDPRSPAAIALRKMGISEADIANRSPGELALIVRQKMIDIAKTTPTGALGIKFGPQGILGTSEFGVGIEQARAFQTLSQQELGEDARRYAALRKTLEQPDPVGKAWQDLETQLEGAGKEIQNTLIKHLVVLAPTLESLSKNAIALVDVLGLGAEKIQKWFGDEDKTDPRLSENPTLARWLDLLVRTAVGSKAANELYGNSAGFADRFGEWGGSQPNGNLLGLVRQLEASGARSISPKGALGTYQIMPGTARDYGGDPGRLFDPTYNERIAGIIIKDLRRKYQTLAEVLVAYNAGEPRANLFRSMGDNPAYLKPETYKYLKHAEALGANLRANVHLTVEDRTGGSVSWNAQQAVPWFPGFGQGTPQ